jgi:hypothetical protein
MIPKRKRNSKSKGQSNSALDQADCPQAPGGPSARPGRTVRGHLADHARPRRTVRVAATDCPKTTPEPPVLHP